MKISSAVRGLEVLSKPIFFEATSAHPKFYVEKHVWPICKTPKSVLVYAKLCLRNGDGELFSELIESTVSPAFLNMTRPLTSSFNPLFYLRINGESPHVR